GNIASHLEEASLLLPDQKAILSAKANGFPEKSFSELYQDVKTTASFLKSKGVGRGDKTLLFVRSGYELIVLAFALFFLGAVPIVIDPGMGLKSLLRCIRSTRPSHMVGIPLAHWVSRFF
ncbi:MAG: AMP-binding protein, partial [Opitutae bacterium]